MQDKIVSIDMSDNSVDGMLLTLESGRVLRFFHNQDCCEDVVFKDGDYLSLVGRLLEDVDVEYKDDDDAAEYESATWSVFTLQLADGAEVLRWHGSSNGYYSEKVELDDLTFSGDELIPDGFAATPYVAKCSEKEFWSVIRDYWCEQGDEVKEACCRVKILMACR